jgi:uncharacterized protein with PQ loop repeat
MNDFTAQILVLLGQLIVILATLSQYVRIIVNKNVKGLSGWTYTLITGSTIAWGIYGIGQGIKVYYFTSFILALIELGIVGHIYVVAKLRRRMEFYAISVGVSLTFLLLQYPKYAGWIGLVFLTLARLPQYKHLIFDKNLKGISPLAHCFFIIAAFLGLVYANYFNLLPVTISAIISIASSSFSLIMLAKKSVRAYN